MLSIELQDFFNSTGGQIVFSIALFIVLFIMLGLLYKKKRFSVRSLTFMAMSISLALILSNVKLFSYSTGGAITAFSMFFITIIGYVYGPLSGILSGVAFGFLSFIVEPQFFTPVQVVLDYPIAFGLLGLSGVFASKKQGIYIGYCIGCLGRMAASTISGIVFFGSFAPEGMNPVIYSLGYNASYIIPEMIMTILIISIPPVKDAIERLKTSI